MIAAAVARPALRRRPRRTATRFAQRSAHGGPYPRGRYPRESRAAPRRPLTALRHLVHVGAGPRLFVLSAGMLATAFLLALLYLRFATSIAAGGYERHALEARRDELRRENALLDLQLRRLDAPARIEAEAQRLGLQKAARTLYLTTGPSLTVR